MSSTSGLIRWMISATVAACALLGVERSVMSWPATLRFSEALNVANRTVLPGGEGDATAGGETVPAAVPAAAIAAQASKRRRVRVMRASRVRIAPI